MKPLRTFVLAASLAFSAPLMAEPATQTSAITYTQTDLQADAAKQVQAAERKLASAERRVEKLRQDLEHARAGAMFVGGLE